jgi:hypothetical protein
MSHTAWVFLIGGFFILLGVGFLLWGRKEARDLEEGLASLHDLREFIEHTPERPEPGALTTGGIIGLALGAGMVIAGFILR